MHVQDFRMHKRPPLLLKMLWTKVQGHLDLLKLRFTGARHQFLWSARQGICPWQHRSMGYFLKTATGVCNGCNPSEIPSFPLVREGFCFRRRLTLGGLVCRSRLLWLLFGWSLFCDKEEHRGRIWTAMGRIRARPQCCLGAQSSGLTQRSEHTLDITRSRVGQSSYTRGMLWLYLWGNSWRSWTRSDLESSVRMRRGLGILALVKRSLIQVLGRDLVESWNIS